MKLAADEVKQIAKLARLELTDAEVEQYRGQLSDVLTYIDQLNEVDTAGVPITAQVTGLTTVLAEDKVKNKPRTDELLQNAPLRDGDSIKVKAVFGE